MRVSGYDRGLDLLRRLALLGAVLVCWVYGSLVWAFLGVFVPAVYIPYILGLMALILLVVFTRLRHVYPPFGSRGGRQACPICGINPLGVFRNRCKVCGREVCYRCLHPTLKWLCEECGKCVICRDNPGYVECSACHHRVCLRCTNGERLCIECAPAPTPKPLTAFELKIPEEPEKCDSSQSLRISEAELVSLVTSHPVSDRALHLLEAAIRDDLNAKKTILWQGKQIESLGASFTVLGLTPPGKALAGLSTKVRARKKASASRERLAIPHQSCPRSRAIRVSFGILPFP